VQTPNLGGGVAGERRKRGVAASVVISPVISLRSRMMLAEAAKLGLVRNNSA